MTYRPRQWVLTAAAILFAIDVALLAVHLLSARVGAGHLDPAWLAVHPWRVDADRGVAEIVQYAKLALVAGGAYVAFRNGYRSGLVLAALFLALLSDDAMQVHERAGVWLAARLELSSVAGLPPYDVGEMLVWLPAAVIFGGLLLFSWLRAHEPEGSFLLVVLVLLFALALFGIALDAAGSLAQARALDRLGATLLEAGGVALSGVATASWLPRGAAWLVNFEGLVTGDSVVAALTDLRITKVVWTLLEEGGEMFTASLLVLHVLGHQARGSLR